MKILLLNFSDTGGGAANGALLLAEALNASEIKAVLGVIQKQTNLPYVQDYCLKHGFLSRLRRKLLRKYEAILFKYFKTTNTILHSLNIYSDLDIQKINNSDFDIVHLHWIGSNTLSIKDISKIKKPIVWTLHDSWPFCGAEHHPDILQNDIRYAQIYTKQNKPASTMGLDLCRFVWQKKKKYLAHKKINFIAPSKWEFDCLKTSSLFAKSKCTVIPNILNNLFHPIDKTLCRTVLQLPHNKKIIGFGAAYDIGKSDSLKGGQILLNTLKKLKNPKEYFLLIFGPADSNFVNSLKIENLCTGYIDNKLMLNLVYNCCDIFICPSIIENLPYTCLESIACGVPVAAFNTGGIPDIIEHKKNGYLAKCYDTDDLLLGIEYILKHQNEMSKKSLKKFKQDFSTADSIEKHINIYKELL